VVQDASGTAYIAWAHHTSGGSGADNAYFCKIPRGGTCATPMSLPIPGATSSSDAITGAFPVLGSGSTVYVMAPRYVRDDVIEYTSTNGGLSFDGGVTINTGSNTTAGPYSNKTNPTNAIPSGTDFLVAANNPGLGFSSFGINQGNFTFASPGDGGVAGSTMGLDGSGNPVIAYWNLASTGQYPLLFYRYNGVGPKTLETNWTGPTAIANGNGPELAGGASGLFLAADEYATSTSPYPTVLTVRKYGGTAFGAPISLGNDPTTGLFDGGTIAQSPSGRVAVAWPTSRGGDSARVMRLYTSTNAGASFAPTADIANIGSGYGIQDNAQVAAADDGQGWLTFRDGGGLQLANFTAVAPYQPGGGGGGGGTPPPAYTGTNKTVSKGLGGGALSGVSITLKVPKSCLQARQAFKVFVGTKVKRKVAKGKHVAVTKVVFGLDGIVLSTVKRGPFTLVVATLGGTSRSVHTVTAKVTVRVRRTHHKTIKVTKTIKGTITIC
jgi:hypothetical protein